ncbi:MAG: hypothetical protein JWR19_730, partial [Pedosphaera sp.]|nr:hypothetical protein [Pedosphaera sp.]
MWKPAGSKREIRIGQSRSRSEIRKARVKCQGLSRRR